MKTRKHYNKLIGSIMLALSMVFTVLFVAVPVEAEELRISTPKYTYKEASHENYIKDKKAEGYLYGGLFDASVAEDGTVDLAELTKENAITDPVDGTEYVVKLVPAGVLAIKGQVSGALLETETYSGSSIRMITAVDSLTYKEIGFSIKRADTGKELVAEGSVTKYVYTELYAVDATDKTGGAITYTPQDIHADANYFKTYAITDVPTKAYNTDMVVVPYWITADGVKVEGTSAIKTVNLGRSWVYVDANAGNDNGLGTYSDPFKTIQAAVNHTNEVEAASAVKPQVILKSDVALNSGAVSIEKSLTVRSEDSSRSASEASTDIHKVTTTDAFPHINMFIIKAGTVNVEKITLDGEAGETATESRAIELDGATLNMDTVTVENFNSNQNGPGILATTGTVNLTNTTIQNCETTRSGGSVYLQTKSTMTMNSGTISGGIATGESFDSKKGLGGNIYAAGESTVVLKGGTISGGNATGDGGNIYLTGSALDVQGKDVTVSGGVATTGGGNIHALTSTVAMSNGTVKEGSSRRGGNICGWSNSLLTITGGTIQDGEATERGGNIVATGKGADDTGVNTIKNATIIGGTVTGTDVRGGSIFVGGNGLTIQEGTTIQGGTATMGGAIYVDAGTLTVSGGSVAGGNATSGGNVYMNVGTLAVSGGSITGGQADNGGNIYLVKNTTLNVTGGTISNGVAETSGGGVYAAASSNLTISGGTISGSQSTTQGGNIYSATKVTVKAPAIIKDGTVSGTNNANGGNIFVNGALLDIDGGTIQGGEAKIGGNITVWGAGSLDIDGGTIKNGVAGNRGGNICAAGTGTQNIAGTATAISHGSVTSTSTGENVGGGNLYVGGKGLTIEGTPTFTGGTAKQGGSIYICNDAATLTVKGGTIKNGGADTEGTVVTANGGSIYCYKGAVSVAGGTITGGKATNQGGNIYVKNRADGAAALTMSAGTVTAGNATEKGGNIYVLTEGVADITGGTISNGKSKTGGNITSWGGSQLNISNAQITGGTATGRGGSIEALGSITMTSGKISGGTTNNQGGNIYIAPYTSGDTILHASKLTMTGGSIENGIAQVGTSNTAGIGGNVYVNGATIDMTNATISGGQSKLSRAGNIYMQGASTLNVNTGAVISGGTSKLNGGNIMVNGGATINIKGGTVKDGTSTGGEGGNFRVGAGSTFNMSSGTISGGQAKSYGGNIVLAGSSTSGTTMTVTGGNITGGVAPTGGSLYLAAYSTLKVQGGTIKDGGTTGTVTSGGNIYMASTYASLEMTNGTITGGNAADKGGNICAWNNSSVKISGGTISNGTAASRGGNICALASVTMSGGTITGGRAWRDATNEVAAAGNGGNIYLMPYGTTIAEDADGNATEKEYENVTLSITGGTISAGTAKINGGNIYTMGVEKVDAAEYDDDGTLTAEKRNGANVNMTLNGATIKNGTAYLNGGNVWAGECVVLKMTGKNTITGGKHIIVGMNDETQEAVETKYNSNLYLAGKENTIALTGTVDTSATIGLHVAGGREGVVVTGVTDAYKNLFTLENIDNKELTYNASTDKLSITLNAPNTYTFTPVWQDGARTVASGLLNFDNKYAQMKTYKASGVDATSGKRRLMSAAHRGDVKNYPDNSVEGYLSAIALGADIIEMDIKSTKDGKLVMWHDAYSDPETGEVISGIMYGTKCNILTVLEEHPELPAANPGSNLIRDWTASELRTYIRLKCNSRQTTYFIPTFQETLNACKGKVFMALDMRVEDTRSRAESIVESSDAATKKSILSNTLYWGNDTDWYASLIKGKESSYGMIFMQAVSSVKFTNGVANYTPAEIGAQLTGATNTIANRNYPKILRCGEYFADYDSQYNAYKQNYRIHIETLKVENDNRATWKKLDNNGWGYSIIHTNDIEGLTDYIQDTWYN